MVNLEQAKRKAICLSTLEQKTYHVVLLNPDAKGEFSFAHGSKYEVTQTPQKNLIKFSYANGQQNSQEASKSSRD